MEHARIGPNAIIQTVEALKEICGTPQADEVLEQGGVSQYQDHLPTEMVEEQEFLALIQVLTGHLGSEKAAEILRQSGQRTARYLLQHRIPMLFQKLLQVLPRRMVSLPLLMLAISKHAWTFVGSGAFHFVRGKQPEIIIANRTQDDHIPPEICSFYGGTFEQIIQVLIDPHATVESRDQTDQQDTVRCAYRIVYRSS